MTRNLKSTPRQDGFRLPADYEPHVGSWMIWPERPDVWRECARPAQLAFARVAEAIGRFEPITVCVTRGQWGVARSMLSESIRVVEMSTNDSWMRDYAPIFVVGEGKSVRGVDWIFNGYGGSKEGCYWPCDYDNLVARKILDIERLDRYEADMVLEGGSIIVDGEGTLISTEECLLNPNRNPNLSKPEIENMLREYLGVDMVIWLRMGVVGDDDNSGHVDDMCSFVKPGTVVLNWTDDESDPQYLRSREAYSQLSTTIDARGRHLEIHKIHQPEPVFFSKEEVSGIAVTGNAVRRTVGQRIGASYINFYVTNGGVIVPGFDDPRDDDAVEILGRLFADREIVQLQTREILLGVGNIHCIVMQQPLGR